ncbi:hypothetical protein ACFOEK_10710 [Litoribrevibacter euphylliae]|uniref:Uncharacterized protein n=1 Tax=Litoribrevibacter euphylliae TaxID=1834034 RepID=A0ABV7HJI7_9GAMM
MKFKTIKTTLAVATLSFFGLGAVQAKEETDQKGPSAEQEQMLFEKAHLHGYYETLLSSVCVDHFVPNVNLMEATYGYLLRNLDTYGTTLKGRLNGKQVALIKSRDAQSRGEFCAEEDLSAEAIVNKMMAGRAKNRERVGQEKTKS